MLLNSQGSYVLVLCLISLPQKNKLGTFGNVPKNLSMVWEYNF